MNLKAKIKATSHDNSASAPMNPKELVPCAKIHSAGANPINSNPAIASMPLSKPPMRAADAFDPARMENIYKLGKQMMPANSMPPPIFTGAAQS